MKTFT